MILTYLAGFPLAKLDHSCIATKLHSLKAGVTVWQALPYIDQLGQEN